jgi:hypothetical protein
MPVGAFDRDLTRACPAQDVDQLTQAGGTGGAP